MYKQSPKSPAMKALVGNQPNLPKGLRDAIEAEAPGKMMKSPAKQAAPKGERDLGEGGLKGLNFPRASSVADEVQKLQNSGVDERDVSTGIRRADSHINSRNALLDQDRARAGNTYYNKYPGNREYTDNTRMTERVRIKQMLARNKAKYSK